MWDGFLLGVANGTSCLATCAPVLVPYLLSEGQSIRRNAWLLAQFLAGRLAGYLAFAVFAWLTGEWIRTTGKATVWFGVIYLFLAATLVGYAIYSPQTTCAAEQARGWTAIFFRRWPKIVPLMLGLLTGVNFCPPFAAALGVAMRSYSIEKTLFFFFSFFLGTALFFLPLPLLGSLKRHGSLRIIGRLAAGIMGAYFLITGTLMVL